jgi:glycerol-3-phosphate dehydrogenase
MAVPHDRRDGPARWSAFSRAANLERLRSERFDVLVIGGGITGAGVALDAASRGLTTALVERTDFASGTSSKSSKLIHGGLRYLQQREFRLVYENLAERQRLLENAPHLVSVLPFLVPLFGRSGVVSKTVARSYSSALWLYDLTGGVRIGKRHSKVSRAEVLQHLPLLDADRLVAGFMYFDARADDARLTLAIIRSAVCGFGAAAANYVSADQLLRDGDGHVRGALVRDLEAAEPAFEVRAEMVVNAAGVWTDRVRGLGRPGMASSIRPAKGVHVSVPRSRLPADIAAVIPVRHDRRSIFVVPWPEADIVYLGTTDTDFDGDLDDPRCGPEDVDYLLAAANAVSSAGLTRDDVRGVWAGLRPLLAPAGGQRISQRTADLSRRHKVWRDSDGLITVTGGKLTTYRKMAEDTVDLALRSRPWPRPRSVTRHLKLEGAPGLGPTPRSPEGVALPAHFASRYGTLAPAVAAMAEEEPTLLEPVVAGLPYTGAELRYAAREEMAVHLDDVLARRTRASILDARAALATAERAAAIVGDELGWDHARQQEEVRRFTALVEAELGSAGLEGGAVAERHETR